MIQRIREWFFQLLTGMKLDQFVLGNVEANQLRDDVKELQEVYTDLLKEWLNMQSSIVHLRESIVKLNDNTIVMSETDANLVRAVNDHHAAILKLTQLGHVHNEHFEKIIDMIRGNEKLSLTTTTIKTDKLN